MMAVAIKLLHSSFSTFFRSVSVKYGRPIELPEQYEAPKSWKVTQQNIPQRKEESRPPLQDDQTWSDDDEEAGDGEEDDDYEEETKENNGSRKQRSTRVKRRHVEQEIDRNFCAMSSCLKITCTIGRLSKDEEVSVIFPAIAWARTIRKVRYCLEFPIRIVNCKLIEGMFAVVNSFRLPSIGRWK